MTKPFNYSLEAIVIPEASSDVYLEMISGSDLIWDAPVNCTLGSAM
jgi:hypothetical protein